MKIEKEMLIKWFVLGILIIVASVIAFNSRGTIGIPKETVGKKNIAFIMKMKSGEYWDTVKMGASAAAKEFEVNVTFDGTEAEEDSTGQINLINIAMKNKADALVLAPSDHEKLVAAVEEVYDAKTPVIIIDSEVDTEKYNCYIGSDNREAGKQAGEKLIWLVGGKARIVVLSFSADNKSASERENGLYEMLNQQSGVEIVAVERVGADPRSAKLQVNGLLDEFKNIDGIVALSSSGSIAAAEALQNRNLTGKIKLVAFDSTNEEIEMLDNGVIQALVVQNPFTIGYMGVKNAVLCLGKEKYERHINTKTKVVDSTNMYLQENQKVLFPFAN